MTSSALPPAPPAFRWTTEPWGHALRCDGLDGVAQHLFTTRQLALRGGMEERPAAWAAAVASVGAGVERLVRVRQVHGRAVRVVRRGSGAAAWAGRPDGDAIVSDEPGLALAVLVADCVPVLLADRRRGVAAAVHAGWRGTCAGIVTAALDVMRREFGVASGDVVAAIGPSIRPCCYEVGEELVEAFRRDGHSAADLARWFTASPAADGGVSLRLDVALANRDQLRAAGVTGIFDCGFCTRTFRETFDSFRADGDRAGRMAAILVVPPAADR